MGNARCVETVVRVGDGKLLDLTVFKNNLQSPLKGSQVTDSENHPGYRRGLRDLADYGGPFFSQKRYVDDKISPRINFRGSRRIGPGLNSDQIVSAQYEGPCLPINLGSNSWPTFIDSSADALDEVGASLVAGCLPTNSPADASQFLGELLQAGPKMGFDLLKKGTSKAKAAGDDYLNAQFGWAPIAKDIGSFLAAVYTADIVMRQYERDAGRVVRRGNSFSPESDKSSSVFRQNESPWTAISTGGMFGNNTGQGRVLRMREVSRERWFSGAFTYYLPSGYNARSEMSKRAFMVKHMLGLRLTPDVAWELAPWSWAADWFTNVGDVLHNITAFASNGLVMRYGYVMEHSFVRDTYAFDGETGFTRPTVVPTLTLVAETKVRRKANPFGFGITWGGLSPFQLSIAAALGLSNSRGRK